MCILYIIDLPILDKKIPEYVIPMLFNSLLKT